MGPTHGDVEFLEGSLPGIEKFAIFWIKENRFGRIYLISMVISRDDIYEFFRRKKFRISRNQYTAPVFGHPSNLAKDQFLLRHRRKSLSLTGVQRKLEFDVL